MLVHKFEIQALLIKNYLLSLNFFFYIVRAKNFPAFMLVLLAGVAVLWVLSKQVSTYVGYFISRCIIKETFLC